MPRAYLAGDMVAVDNFETALAVLQEQAGLVTVVEGTLDGAQAAEPGDYTEIVAYAAEQVRIHTKSANPALLVLSDSFYPGWTATVDGRPAEIKAVNGLFRGVVIPAGEREVIFTFEPTGWRSGLYLAAAGALLLATACSAGIALVVRRHRTRAV
jgi:uncharacterized membrane protein YfhO